MGNIPNFWEIDHAIHSHLGVIENVLEMSSRKLVLLLKALYIINHLLLELFTPDSENRHVTLNVEALF